MTGPRQNRVVAAQLKVRLVIDSDSAALNAFTCGEPDLDDFLRNDAARLGRQRVVRTYVAFFDGELVGYVALLADAVVLDTKERRKLALGSQGHPVVPALKIARPPGELGRDP